MQKQVNTQKKIDEYLDHLENLSSKMSDNISMGRFNDIDKMDLERRNIINKISLDAANLNHRRKNRLKLVWVNNNKMITSFEEMNNKKKKDYIKLKKTLTAYSNNLT